MSDREWRDRAERAVAGGASTGSKRPPTMFGTEHHDAPAHFVRALGCRVVTVDGATLVDCTMALGAVAFGYADDEVVRRIARVAANGNVAGLSHFLEVEIAERLCARLPCGERALFTKSGAEGVAAAVRLARTNTGRDVVVGSGYFGWLDWCSDAQGVPDGVRRDFVPVPWGDVDALAAAVQAAGENLAAIVVEPVVERAPDPAWLDQARRLADRARAVLIFDEVKTAFRLHAGGYQSVAGVTPDVAVVGKALANGFPLAAVVGHADVMEAVRHTWISGTLASEGVALAAAQAVLDRHDRDDVCARLALVGGRMRAAVTEALDESGLHGVRVEGLDPMWFVRWSDAESETRFLAASRAVGVLFKRGAYDYASLAHDDEEAIGAIGHAAAAGFDAVRKLDAE